MCVQCVCVSVCVCTVCSLNSSRRCKALVKFLFLSFLSQPKLLSNVSPCISLHTQIVCKNGPRPSCFSTRRVFTATTQANPVGRRWLALRVFIGYFILQKSEVAEFVCKFKCLLPDATLNFWFACVDGGRWEKKGNNSRRGQIFFFSDRFSVGCWRRLVKRCWTTEDKIFVL